MFQVLSLIIGRSAYKIKIHSNLSLETSEKLYCPKSVSFSYVIVKLLFVVNHSWERMTEAVQVLV